MPPRSVRKKENPAAVPPASGRDHLSELPADLLEHVLSFLPALDAVRTYAVARRWRHIWKSIPVLRILCGRNKEPASVEELRKFVDNLLRIRRDLDSPIDTCEFNFRLLKLAKDDIPRIDIWIHQALGCKVRVLRLHIEPCRGIGYPPYFEPDDRPLISKHLTKLELKGVYQIGSRFLDFSNCPVLEDLKILGCNFDDARTLKSQSLTSLRIDDADLPDEYRMEIYAPNLVSLWLQVYDGCTPWLEGMPSLAAAVVKIDADDNDDSCFGSFSSWDCDDPDCGCDRNYDNNQCILLQSLSEAQNLVLMSHDIHKFVFRSNLRFCPTFNNLKTLFLNEYWCEPADFSALACLLEHSPVLEKLTLQLYSKGPKHKVEIKLICKPMDKSAAVSEHLQAVEIKCQVFDERVHNALKFLGDLNIWFQSDGIKCSAQRWMCYE